MAWDHLFGTYAPERETPTCGLTHDLDARTPLGIVAGGYPQPVRDVRATAGVATAPVSASGRRA